MNGGESSSSTFSNYQTYDQRIRVLMEDQNIRAFTHWTDKKNRLWLVVNIDHKTVDLLHVRKYGAIEQRFVKRKDSLEMIEAVRSGKLQEWNGSPINFTT